MKNQAKAKQHLEAHLLLFQNYSIFNSCYHPKIIGDILKIAQKTSNSV